MHQLITRFDYGWLTLNGLCGDVAESRSRLKRYRRPSGSVAEEAFDLISASIVLSECFGDALNNQRLSEYATYTNDRRR